MRAHSGSPKRSARHIPCREHSPGPRLVRYGERNDQCESARLRSDGPRSSTAQSSGFLLRRLWVGVPPGALYSRCAGLLSVPQLDYLAPMAAYRKKGEIDPSLKTPTPHVERKGRPRTRNAVVRWRTAVAHGMASPSSRSTGGEEV